MTRLFSRPQVYLLLGAGALGTLITGAQGWWQATAGSQAATLSGTVVSGGLTQALGVVALAGILLSLTLRARGTQVLGAVLVLVGVGAAVVGLSRPAPTDADVVEALQGMAMLAEPSLEPTVWNIIYAICGLVLALGGAGALVGAPRWQTRAHRFERSGTAVDLEDPHAIWKAMDDGVDPTADPVAEGEESGVRSTAEPDPATKRKSTK